jgi:hypothetical protein
MTNTLDQQKSIEYSYLSREVYDLDKNDIGFQNEYGWEFLESSDRLNIGTDSGYFGAVYRKAGTIPETFEYAIVHRGTAMLSLDDWVANARLKFGAVSSQYEDAKAFVERVSADIADASSVSHVGHSLGGALAKMVGLENGSSDIWSFNGFGIEHL